MECAMLPEIVTGSKEAAPQLNIDVFQNPLMGALTIKSHWYNASYTLFDPEERSVTQGKLTRHQLFYQSIISTPECIL